VGSEAKRSSRRCLTLVSVAMPTAARTPLPTKFAVAEKHMLVAVLGLWMMIAQVLDEVRSCCCGVVVFK